MALWRLISGACSHRPNITSAYGPIGSCGVVRFEWLGYYYSVMGRFRLGPWVALWGRRRAQEKQFCFLESEETERGDGAGREGFWLEMGHAKYSSTTIPSEPATSHMFSSFVSVSNSGGRNFGLIRPLLLGSRPRRRAGIFSPGAIQKGEREKHDLRVNYIERIKVFRAASKTRVL